MLATPSASSVPTIVLDLTSSNWTPFKKQTFRLLQTSYGRIGNSVITGTPPPTNTIPTQNDVTTTGAPVFHRLLPTAAQVTANTPALELELSSFGYNMLRDAITRTLAQTKIDEKDDNDLLTYLFSNMSSESHLALETHPTYPTFRAAKLGLKSFSCWTILTTIHSTGNASTKLLRTRQLLNSHQGDKTLSEYIQTMASDFEQFKVDFGSPTNPDMVSVAQLHCFALLTGIPSNGLYNLPINTLLAANPDARFTDPAALATTLLNWEKSSALLHLSDTPSTQASAYLAVQPPPNKSTSPPSVFCIHCHKRYPKKPKTSSHTSLSCGLNPANRHPTSTPSVYNNMKSLLAQAEAATPGSPTSINLLMQLTDTAFEETLKTET